MALNDVSLKAAIKAMFDDVRDGKTTDEAAEQLKSIISDYVRSATVTVASGIPVATTGSAVAQTGTTTGTGTGTLS